MEDLMRLRARGGRAIGIDLSSLPLVIAGLTRNLYTIKRTMRLRIKSAMTGIWVCERFVL